MIGLLSLIALAAQASTAPPVIKPYGEVLLNYEMQCSSQDASETALQLEVQVIGEGSSRKALIKSHNAGLFPSGQFASKVNFLHLMLGRVGDPLRYAEGFFTKDDTRLYTLDYFYEAGAMSKAQIEILHLSPDGKLSRKDRMNVPLTCQQRPSQS